LVRKRTVASEEVDEDAGVTEKIAEEDGTRLEELLAGCEYAAVRTEKLFQFKMFFHHAPCRHWDCKRRFAADGAGLHGGKRGMSGSR
jgi:hypothetical protein